MDQAFLWMMEYIIIWPAIVIACLGGLCRIIAGMFEKPPPKGSVKPRPRRELYVSSVRAGPFTIRSRPRR